MCRWNRKPARPTENARKRMERSPSPFRNVGIAQMAAARYMRLDLISGEIGNVWHIGRHPVAI
jgi:hypothetical protein